MTEITYNYENITANVKPYRGYDDFIHSIRIRVSATDGTHVEYIDANYELEVDRLFTEENPFIPFDQWDQAKVLELADQLTAKVGIKERLARKLKIKAAQPKPKNFNF